MSEINIEIETSEDTIEASINTDETTELDLENSDVVGSGETTNYEKLSNKPQINSIELIGNQSSDNLGLQDEMEALTNVEIENLISNFL